MANGSSVNLPTRKINASVRLDVVDDFDQPSPFTDVTS